MPSTPWAQIDTLYVAVVWPLVVTPPVRGLTVNANALAEHPLQVTDFISDFGSIAFTVKLTGVDTQGETASDHLKRQIANLRAVVGKDTFTFQYRLTGESATATYACHKSLPPVVTMDPLYELRHVAMVDVVLTYL